jgi:hypothetical protein
LKVAKDVVEPPTEAITYGKQFHSAAEHYVRDDVPLPPQFNYAKPTLDNLRQLAGDKYCEYEFGLTENLEPCGFKDPNVWWRGVADLLVINGEEARCVDYKTGKSAKYADTDQLELMALAIFKHFPEVKKVKAGLLFVVAHDFVKADFDSEQQGIYWMRWLDDTARLEKSIELDVWNPRPNFSCKNWCPVKDCTHNGKGVYR